MVAGAILRRSWGMSRRGAGSSNRCKTCTRRNKCEHRVNPVASPGRSTHIRGAFEAWRNLRKLGRWSLNEDCLGNDGERGLLAACSLLPEAAFEVLKHGLNLLSLRRAGFKATPIDDALQHVELCFRADGAALKKQKVSFRIAAPDFA